MGRGRGAPGEVAGGGVCGPARAGLERRIPLHRIAETDDVVGASLLLCTDAASFITGQVLTLDGGLTACQ